MTSEKSSDKYNAKRFYGRRTGKRLNTSRAEALDTLLPKLCLSDEELSSTLRIKDVFAKSHDHNILEIGFGTGEHFLELARQNPDSGLIGVEPFINGMASFLRDLGEDSALPQDNIRVYMDDAMLVVEALEDQCLDKIYILNPDPWHKARHHKRRIIKPQNLDQFARVLKPGGQLVSSTDVPYLAEWIVEHTEAHKAFDWAAGNGDNWKQRPDWWIDNKYATKGAKGASEMHYMVFDKTL